jgi:putative membrane protein
VTHNHQPVGGTTTGVALVLLLAVIYEVMALRQRPGRVWPDTRTAAFLGGCLALATGLSPGLSPWPTGDFRTHMLQHLLVGMVAPLGLVLGAPITLVLRSVPRPLGRRLVRLLHHRALRPVAHPVSALVLSVGGFVVLYVTPLYVLAATRPVLHSPITLHFLLAGCLFVWVLAGPDPAPRRPSVPARLFVLGVAVAAHAVLSQLLYAGAVGPAEIPTVQRQGAATLMYYGGDIAELLVAAALVASWRPTRRRASPTGTPIQAGQTATRSA